jgi:hypothetical protein
MLRPQAIAVKTCPDYCLLVTFSNNEKRIFDVKPYLSFAPFRELKNISLFNTVKPAGLSIEWLHGQDICPDELYYNSVSVNPKELLHACTCEAELDTIEKRLNA